MHRSWTLARSAKYSALAAGCIGVGTATVLERRLSLDQYKDVELSAEYYRTRPATALCSSLFVYTISSSPMMVALGKASINTCDAIGLPLLYEFLARRTFFAQFCGGETYTEVQETMRDLRRENLGVILTYAREEQASEAEEGFDRVKQDTFRTIEVASTLPNNFVALKLTALAKPEAIKAHSAFLKAQTSTEQYERRLSPQDQEQIMNLQDRLEEIMEYCVEKGVKVQIDAEQDRYQATIEKLTRDVSVKYNTEEAYAYGTYQCYLKHMPAKLASDLKDSEANDYKLGVKLVRGAYISSEPRHLIHDTKADSDKCYDDAIRALLPNQNVETFIASHNAESIELALDLLPKSGGAVSFAQLYGMSSPMTYALLKRIESMPQTQSMKQGGGLRVYSYVPWGTVSEAMKYLLRRADENSSMIERGKAERNEIFFEVCRRLRPF